MGPRDRIPNMPSPFVSLTAAFLWLVACPGAQGCGYHDPTGVGTLNFVYPKALYVRTAVWQAQQQGLIPPREPGSPSVAVAAARANGVVSFQDVAFRNTARRLEGLRESMSSNRGSQPVPPFAVVLIGPMLWTRFEAPVQRLEMTFHAPGPSAGDVVVVTDEPVLAALVDGTLTATQARDAGLVRFYGAPDAIQDVQALFDASPPAAVAAQISH
jgi:hypothetical protein